MCPACSAATPLMTEAFVVLPKGLEVTQVRYQCSCGFIWASPGMRRLNKQLYDLAKDRQ